LGGRAAVPLLRDPGQGPGRADAGRPPQRVLHHFLVVAVDRPDVLQPEVLEQHLRLQHVLDALLDPVQRVVQWRAGGRGAPEGGLYVVGHVLLPPPHPPPRPVVGPPPPPPPVRRARVLRPPHHPTLLCRVSAMLFRPSQAIPPVSAPSPITATTVRSLSPRSR